VTLSLSLSDLAHRYPSDLCNQGIDLYNDGRVGDLYFDEGRIESEVEGNRDSYTVRISLNNRGVPVDTDCSCSYCFQAGHCSHIIALLVKLINEKVQLVALSSRSSGAEILKGDSFEDFPVSPLDRGQSRNYILPLYEGLNEPIPHALPGRIPEGETTGAKSTFSQSRWKGVLNLRLRGGGWRVCPALLYIKKDGSPGRIERTFSLSRITEPLKEAEERLFRFWSLIPHGSEEGLAFEKVASFLLDDRDSLTLINDKGETYSFREILRLGLSFNPTGIPSEGMEKGALQFEPEFSPHFPSEEIYSPKHLLFIWEDRIYFTSPQSSLIFHFELKDKRTLFEYLLSRREQFYRLGEIEALQREFASSFDDKLVWQFISTHIECRDITPTTLLTCHNTGLGGCGFKLSFDYEGQGEFSYSRFKRETAQLYRIRKEESQNRQIIFRRDLTRESEIFSWLENWFLTLFGPVPYGSSINFKGVYDFYIEKDLHDFLMDRSDELLDRGIELRLEKQKGRIVGRGGGDWNFNGIAYKEWLSLSLSNDKTGEVDLAEFLQGGFLRSGSELILISPKEREKLRKILEKGELKEGKLIISPHDFEALELIEDSFGLAEGGEDIARIRERAQRLKEFEKIEEITLPDNFQGILRPYQKGGYDWLHFLYRYGLGGCLADDMGLGKTVQTLCFLQSLKEKNELGQVLLLAPVTTLSNWKREAEKFTPALSVVVHSGVKRGKTRQDLKQGDLILSSYQTFLRDAEWMQKEPWSSLILDEAQAVKNWQSRTRQAIKKLDASFRLALTGTPVENGMIELWSLFDLLEPGLLGSRDMFRRRYQIPLERDGDKNRQEELKKRVAPLMLRRKKAEVLQDLPEKEENLVWLEMDEEQRLIYDKARKGFLALIEETLKDKEVSQAAMEILTALLRLRQLSVAPVLADKQYGAVPSCKMDYLDYFFDEMEAEDHRVLIFSQFVSALTLVRKRLDQRGTAYSYLDGSTKNREDVIREFQEDEGPPVFLISLKAGGVGINLTAADYVLLLDPWWNPAVENQAVDRAHRMGQKRSVMVYKPIVRDTVEEKILELQQSKKDLASELITEESGFLKSLSREEVTELFR
jgi:superfamily II DNA or RNA helicase